MRRVLFVLALLLALCGRAIAVDAIWNQNNRAANFQLDQLHDPTTSKDPATAAFRLGDFPQGGTPCVLQATGSNGKPICATVAGFTVAGAPLQLSGTTLSFLWDNASLTLNGGGGLQRAALTFSGAVTGTMTAGVNTLTLAQGTGAATSVLGVAGSSAARADIQATADNQVFQRLAGTVQAHTLDYSQLTGTPAAVTSVTGAVVGTGPGATATTFGSQSGPSLFGVASGSSGVPAPINATGTNTIPLYNGTSIAWGAYPYAALFGAPTLHYQTVIGFAQEPALDVGTASATGLSASDNSGVSTRLFNTLVPGLAGGQTITGGTAVTDSLLIRANTIGHTGTTKAPIYLQDTTSAFYGPDSSLGAQLIIGNWLSFYAGASTSLGATGGILIGGTTGPAANAPIDIRVNANSNEIVSIVNTSNGASASAGVQFGVVSSGPTGQAFMVGSGYSGVGLYTPGTVIFRYGGAGGAGNNVLFDVANATSGNLLFAHNGVLHWDMPFGGGLIGAETAAPGSPASGFGATWLDSTFHNLWAENSSGGVSHTVKTATAVSGEFVTAIDDDGTVHLATPGASSVTLTGPVTGTGTSTIATTVNLGAGGISGTLALGNQAAPTGTGFFHVTGGVQDSAARAVNLSGADVTALLPVASVAPSGTNGWVMTTVSGVSVWQAPASPGVGTVTNVSMTAGDGTVASPTSTPVISLANVGPGANTYGGTGLSSLQIDGRGRVVNIGVANYQPALTFTAANWVLASTGSGFTGDGTFQLDPSTKVVTAEGLAVNGYSMPTNVMLGVNRSTNSNRDREQHFLGGGALGATGTGDNTLFDIYGDTNPVQAGVTGGIYSTVRIHPAAYTGSGQTIGEPTSLYVEAPTTSGISSAFPLAIHAVGDVLVTGDFGVTGTVSFTSLAGSRGIVLTSDTFGDLGTSGAMPAGDLVWDGAGNVSTSVGAVMYSKDYYFDIPGALISGSPNWIATSSPTVFSSSAIEYAVPYAVTGVHMFISGRIMNNPIVGGIAPGISIRITKNGTAMVGVLQTFGVGVTGNFNGIFVSTTSFAAGDMLGAQIITNATLAGTNFTGTVSFGWDQQ